MTDVVKVSPQLDMIGLCYLRESSDVYLLRLRVALMWRCVEVTGLAPSFGCWGKGKFPLIFGFLMGGEEAFMNST